MAPRRDCIETHFCRYSEGRIHFFLDCTNSPVCRPSPINLIRSYTSSGAVLYYAPLTTKYNQSPNQSTTPIILAIYHIHLFHPPCLHNSQLTTPSSSSYLTNPRPPPHIFALIHTSHLNMPTRPVSHAKIFHAHHLAKRNYFSQRDYIILEWVCGVLIVLTLASFAGIIIKKVWFPRR
jgi:hypothetical protein